MPTFYTARNWRALRGYFLLAGLMLLPVFVPVSGAAQSMRMCTDTLQFAQGRNNLVSGALQTVTIGPGSATAIGQFIPFEASQGALLSGLSAYGRVEGLPLTDTTLAIPFVLYEVGPDTLPTTTVVLRDTFTFDNIRLPLNIDSLKDTVQFPALAADRPLYFVLENPHSIQVSISCSDYESGAGQGNYWASAQLPTQGWLRGDAVIIGQFDLDADFLLEPYVSYSISTQQETPSAGPCSAQQIDLQKTVTPLSVFNNPLFNRAVLEGEPYLSVNFGDGNPNVYTSGGAYQYTQNGMYGIVALDSVMRWTAPACAVTDTDSVMLPFFTPEPALTLLGPDTLCLGETTQLGLTVADFDQIRWSTELTGDTVLTVRDSGRYSVRVTDTASGCVATLPDTLIVVRDAPRVTIQPNFMTRNNCVGDTLFLEAPMGFQQYRWSTGTVGRFDTLVGGPHLFSLQIIDTSFAECPATTGWLSVVPVTPDTAQITQLNDSTLLSSVNAAGLQWLDRDGRPIPGAVDLFFRPDVPDTATFYLALTNAAGCTGISEPFLFTPTIGLQEGHDRLALGVYPNPASDRLQVNVGGSGAGSLEVSDLQGRVQGASPIEATDQQVVLSVGNLPAGVYVLKAARNGRVGVARVVVQR